MSITMAPSNQSVYVKNTTISTHEHANAKQQIELALHKQFARYEQNYLYNGRLGSSQIVKYVSLSHDCRQFLSDAANRLSLSARAYFKTIKVARTIADIDDCDNISIEHLAEALQFRNV